MSLPTDKEGEAAPLQNTSVSQSITSPGPGDSLLPLQGGTFLYCLEAEVVRPEVSVLKLQVPSDLSKDLRFSSF